MKQLNHKINKYGFVIHPILFTVFPLLSFYGANLAEIRSGDFNLINFLVFNLVATGIIWLLALLMTRNAKKASLLALAFLIVFFTFGRLHNSLQGFVINTPIVPIGPTKILLLGSGVFIALVWLWVRRLSSGNVDRINSTLTLVGSVIIASTLIPIVQQHLSGSREVSKQEQPVQTSVKTKANSQDLPDIYYILLDGYTRADFLKDNFGYDNSSFLDSLRKGGFYIAEKANSNYAHTHFSVPSTFNMKYLNYLTDELGEESTDRSPLKELLDHNKVVLTLKSLGYKYVNIGTQWGWSKTSPLQDIEIKADNQTESKVLGFELDEAALVYLQTTLLKPWIEKDIRGTIVTQILDALDKTKQAAKLAEPTFTFTHLLPPHPPYLFDRNGIIPGQTKLELDNHGFSDRKKFVEQTIYTNKFTLDLVKQIMANSAKPPIIIVASDHGSAASLGTSDFVNIDPNNLDKEGVKERMGILNAYYFPDKNYKNLYKNITPVNTFRVILSQYFGENLELLPDKSYFSSNRDKEYQMFDVTELVR